MTRVLILCPTTFGYEKRTRDAVERVGHTVDAMDERIGNSFFAKGAIRSGLIRWMPWLLKKHVDAIIARVKEFKAERLLLLDPETITGKELAQIKAACPDLGITIYTWDTFNRKPISAQAFALADAVYSFDPVDCAKYPDLRHMPLFHNYREPQKPSEAEKVYDFSFIGTARGRRIRALARIEKELRRTNRPAYFHIVTQSALHHAAFRLVATLCGYQGILSRKRVEYADYLDIIQKSRCIVDIEFSDQSGLTMRTFEVAFSGVPLLTTNELVRRYDFFSASSIFTFNDATPELPAAEELVYSDNTAFFEKYSIESWARNVMDGRTMTYMLDREGADTVRSGTTG